MKNITSDKRIINNQRTAVEALLTLKPLPRFVVGLVGSAVLAFYIPLIMITLTGKWINNLTGDAWLANLIGIMVLLAQNLIGNKIKRIMPTGIIFAVLMLCYYGGLIIRGWGWGDWKGWWPFLFFSAVSYPLNAYVLLKYKRATDL